MRSLEWAPKQYDWCPYKREIQTEAHVEGRHYEKAQGEESHLQAKEKTQNRFSITASERTNSANTFILDFQPPERLDNTFLWFKPASLWSFVTAALANSYRGKGSKMRKKL